MTDITELAQSLKAAADREMICRDGAETSEIWERNVTPENILALVDALEKAQRHANLTEAERQAYLGLISKRDERIAEQEEAEQKLCAANVTLDARAKLAERQLAELESRTVKLPGWFVKDAIAVYDRDEIEEALAAAGIKVEAE